MGDPSPAPGPCLLQTTVHLGVGGLGPPCYHCPDSWDSMGLVGQQRARPRQCSRQLRVSCERSSSSVSSGGCVAMDQGGARTYERATGHLPLASRLSGYRCRWTYLRSCHQSSLRIVTASSSSMPLTLRTARYVPGVASLIAKRVVSPFWRPKPPLRTV